MAPHQANSDRQPGSAAWIGSLDRQPGSAAWIGGWSRFGFGVLSIMLPGADCSPTPRPCNNPGECEEGAQYPACIQYCVPRLSRDDAYGETCVVDPCHPDLVQAGTAILCPDGLTCVSTDGEHGRCLDIGQHFLSPCDPSPINPCATGLYCRPFEDQGCPGGPVRPTITNYYNGAGGVCTVPVREGGSCDANWGQPGCRVCEPGTTCSPDPERGGSLRCLRPCDVDGDCPCVDGADPSQCRGDLNPGDGDKDGLCSVCVPHLAECEYRAPNPEMDLFCAENPGAEGCFDWVSGTPYGCCNSGDECKPRTVGGGTYPSVDTGFCCSTTSTQCENDDDCCPGTVCSSLDGTCHPCDGLGKANVHGCCPHLDDRGGICRPECDEELLGNPCMRNSCRGIETVWTCTDETGMECLPAPGEPIGPDDNCDGIDNDCEGGVDEGWVPAEPECEFEDPRCPGRMFHGIWDCRDGSVVCVADEEYCVYDYGTHALVHGNTTTCRQGHINCATGGHADCPPNAYCRVDDCWLDMWGMPMRVCWPHGQPYANCPPTTPPYTTDQICNSGFICFEPTESNTTGFACPTP